METISLQCKHIEKIAFFYSFLKLLYNMLRFAYDVLQLEMENEDVIEVYQEQTGGWLL